jgi:hypothetical protein
MTDPVEPREKRSRATMLMIVALSLLVGVAVALFGINLARNHFERYPPGAERAFLVQCERAGSAQTCGCVLNALEKGYTYKEFTGIADTYARSGTLPQAAVDAVAGCARLPKQFK